MTEIDPAQPIFSQRDVAACTILDKGSLDNYIQHGHATPKMINGRRTFTAFDMVYIQIIAQLAAIFSIPPLVGRGLATKLLQNYVSLSGGAFFKDAREATDDPTWINAATIHGDVEANDLHLSFPVQLMARAVLARAHSILNGTPAA